MTATLANLRPVTVYQARVVVTNPTGTTAGAFVTFTTPSAPSHPALGHVRQSTRRWREGTSLAQLSRRRPPVGTTFSFTLNQPARVTFTFTRTVSGRKVHGHCRAQNKANRNKRTCKRQVPAGSLTVPGHTGSDRVRFGGRLSRAKRLPPGRYTVRVLATNAAGLSSSPAVLRFTILKR